MEPLSKRSDQELFLLLQKGDARAYTEVFLRYNRLLVAHAYRFLADRDAARDIVQDVFMALWQKRETLKLSGSFSAYLYTAARNRIFDQFSHQEVVGRYADSVMQFVENRQVMADDLLIEKELAILIEKEIHLLPENMRIAFILRKQQELSYTEIAGELGISEAAAKQQVYNALKVLRLKITHMLSALLF